MVYFNNIVKLLKRLFCRHRQKRVKYTPAVIVEKVCSDCGKVLKTNSDYEKENRDGKQTIGN